MYSNQSSSATFRSVHFSLRGLPEKEKRRLRELEDLFLRGQTYDVIMRDNFVLIIEKRRRKRKIEVIYKDDMPLLSSEELLSVLAEEILKRR